VQQPFLVEWTILNALRDGVKLPQSKPDGFASSLWEGANPLSHLASLDASSPEGGALDICRSVQKAPPSGELTRRKA